MAVSNKMTSTITLYRVHRGISPKTYQVTQAYVIHTQEPLHTPQYHSNSVYVDNQHAGWFETYIYPILEKHNGDNIMFHWAGSSSTFVTVAMQVDEFLIPDLLANTTSFRDTPETHAQIRSEISAAIQSFNTI